MDTNTQDIAKIAAELAGDPAAEDSVNREIARSTVVTTLLQLRVSRGFSQEQVAKAMGCGPSKISRLEAGNDVNLKLYDVIGYANALGQATTISFDDPSLPVAARIKNHVFRIAADLDELAKLGASNGDDERIAGKIRQFYGDVLFNFLVRYQDGYDKLNTGIKLRSSGKGGAEIEPMASPAAPAPLESAEVHCGA